jgi:PEP-CTERM/exosortase A-associated glycosyltransferase
MREVASTYRPDVIHAHSPVLNAIPALRVGRQLGIPVVYEIRAFWEDAAVDHGSYHEGSWKYRLVRLLETWVCRRAAHVITLCDGLRLDLIRRGIPAEKLSIVRNGISLEEFRECERDAELTKKYCLDGKKVIGYVGSFYRYEGLDLLLDAFALLGNRHKELVLLLVGGGEMHEALKERVRRLGWENRVHLPGRIPHDRVAGVYAAMDVLAYPRYSMRLTNLVTPLKPLEAMAMGKAVIASNIGGHRELIRDGETGILFPAGDAGALASAIERLLLDQNLRTAIARRGRDWVRQEHPWEKTTAIYRDVYARALKRD